MSSEPGDTSKYQLEEGDESGTCAFVNKRAFYDTNDKDIEQFEPKESIIDLNLVQDHSEDSELQNDVLLGDTLRQSTEEHVNEPSLKNELDTENVDSHADSTVVDEINDGTTNAEVLVSNDVSSASADHVKRDLNKENQIEEKSEEAEKLENLEEEQVEESKADAIDPSVSPSQQEDALEAQAEVQEITQNETEPQDINSVDLQTLENVGIPIEDAKSDEQVSPETQLPLDVDTAVVEADPSVSPLPELNIETESQVAESEMKADDAEPLVSSFPENVESSDANFEEDVKETFQQEQEPLTEDADADPLVSFLEEIEQEDALSKFEEETESHSGEVVEEGSQVIDSQPVDEEPSNADLNVALEEKTYTETEAYHLSEQNETMMPWDEVDNSLVSPLETSLHTDITSGAAPDHVPAPATLPVQEKHSLEYSVGNLEEASIVLDDSKQTVSDLQDTLTLLKVELEPSMPWDEAASHTSGTNEKLNPQKDEVSMPWEEAGEVSKLEVSKEESLMPWDEAKPIDQGADVKQLEEPNESEVMPWEETNTKESPQLQEDSMPWDEPQNSKSIEEKDEKDAFEFLQEDDTDNQFLGDDTNDKNESEKSFSFLEDEFEPLLEEELLQQVQSPVEKLPSNRYAPKAHQAQSSYSIPKQQPQQVSQVMQPPTLKPKKSFFEELPPVSELSNSRLTIPSKPNPYAKIVQHQHPQLSAPGPSPGSVATVPVSQPPVNPYAPSQSGLKVQQESARSPSIPHAMTAKESISQGFNSLKAPASKVGPPRSVSRASSVASKSFFEELPILNSPTSVHAPKNPYAPMVHHPEIAAPLVTGTMPPPPTNPYGLAQTSHRRISSTHSGSFAPAAPHPQGGYAPIPSHGHYGSIPNGNVVVPAMAQGSHKTYAPQTAQPPSLSHENVGGSVGSRSRASTYLPQSSKPNIYSPIQKLSPVIGSATFNNPFPNGPVSPKASKYAPAPPQLTSPPFMNPPMFPGFNGQQASNTFVPLEQVQNPPPQVSKPNLPVYNTPQLQMPFTSTFSKPVPPGNNFSVPPQVPFHAPVNTQFQGPVNVHPTRQFPVFRFHRSKKVAKVLQPGSVEVNDVNSIGILSDIDRNFGPLSKSKSKKANVESWIDEKLKYLATDGPVNQNSSLLYSILKELVKGDGLVKDYTSIVEQLSKTSMVQFSSNQSFTIQALSALTETPRKDIAFNLFSYLQEGKKQDSLQYLISQKEWPLAFIIGSTVSPEYLSNVINQYLLEIFGVDRNSSSFVLYFVLSILSGNVQSLVTRLQFDNYTFNYVVQNFSVILKLVLQAGSNLNPFFIEFGCLLIKKNEVLLGQCLLALASYGLSEREIQPGVQFSVLGADAKTDRGFDRSIDVMIMTEIYEYALKLSSSNPIPEFGFAHLIRLKVSHAGLLADDGSFTTCQKYTDYLPSILKSASKTFKIDPSIVTELEELGSRVTDTGEIGWFGARPKLIGMLDKGFSKFIAGEETLPAAKQADAVFTTYSPSVSRTQSVADFGSPSYAQTRPSFNQSNSFMGYDALAPSSGDRRDSSNLPSRGNNRYNPLSMTNISAANVQQPSFPAPHRSESFASSIHTPSQAAIQRGTIVDPGFNEPVSSQIPQRVPSPSMKSDYNDDIAEIRSTISRTSNTSRYAPVSVPAAPLSSSVIPEVEYNNGGSINTHGEGDMPTKLPTLQGSLPLADSTVTLLNAAAPQSENGYAVHEGVQTSSEADPSDKIAQVYNPDQLVSSTLPKRSLSYSSHAGPENELSDASFALIEDSQGDIYDETPSKPRNHVSQPALRKASSPINPYANLTAVKPKKNNRYAPSPALAAASAASVGDQVTNSLDAIVSGDVDFYSIGGYARPEVSATLEQNAEVESTGEAEQNFHPVAPMPLPYTTVRDEDTRTYSSSSPSQNFRPPNVSYSPRIPTEEDDDYNDDVVEDDDEDEDDGAEVRAKAAAALAEVERKRREEELLAKRREEEARKKEGSKSGWFGGLFGGAKHGNKEDKKVYRAKLGDSSTFYYDENLKRWVNKDSVGEAEGASTPPPPPPTVKVPKKNSDTPLPPSALHAGGVPPPPASNMPPQSHSAPPLLPLATPPPGRRTVSKKSAAGDIDEILNMASSTKSTTRSKRGPRRGYVDVMNT